LNASVENEEEGDMDVQGEVTMTGVSRKRRRGGEIGRDWVCQVKECRKDFKSVRRSPHTYTIPLIRL
jgi:general transcription factor IIIA